MENSWQGKCGSTLQSSMPSMVSSSSQEPRKQIENGSSHYFYPHVGQDSRSYGRMPNLAFPDIRNLSSYSSGANIGNSFLALLSGPASLLQCDFQEMSNPPKPLSASSNLPIEGTGITVSTTGSRAPLTGSGLPSDGLSCQIPQNGADHHPGVSSRPAASSSSGGNSFLHYGHQAANISSQSSNLAKAAIHHMGPGNERSKDFPFCSTIPGCAARLQNMEIQMPQRMPVQTESSFANNSSGLTSGCPRVYCLGTSGDLLLSNTGLLGILCSCHCFHMSVSKFCEHSGLLNVNPGDAVHMDSGETIAQWRQLYFQKFGIRVPADQNGWDWPEGLSLTASLLKSGVSAPNISKPSDLNRLICPPGGLLRSEQPLDDSVFPKSTVADQNSAIDALHNKQQRNGQDGNKFLLKSLVGTLQRTSRDVRNNQVMDCSIPRCSTMPKFVSRGTGCPSIPAYVDAILKTGSMSTTHHTPQNLRTLLKSSDACGAKNVKDGVIVDKDTTSSIELRLGQPCHKSRSPGNSILELCNRLDSQRPLLQEQIIHNVTSCRAAEKSMHYLPHATGRSDSATGREQDQNYRNHAISNAMDLTKLEKLKDDLAGMSVLSLFKNFNSPPEGSSLSRVTNDVVNVSKHIMPGALHCESRTDKCDPVNACWNGGNSLERQWDVPELGSFGLSNKDRGEGCLIGYSHSETGSTSNMRKWMINSNSSNGILGGNSDSGLPVTSDKNCYSHHLPTVPPYVSNAGNFSNCVEKVPFVGSRGHMDHLFLRSMESPIAYGKIFPSEAGPTGVPSTSTSIPGLTPDFLKQESIGVSPYLLDDNLRLLALRQILELSKQQHAMTSLVKNIEQGTCGNPSDIKLQHSVFETSTSGEQRHGHNVTSHMDVTEVMKSIQPGSTSELGNGVDISAPVTGLNNCCNFLAFSRGMALQYKEPDMQCQLFHGSLQHERPSSRSANIMHSNGHGNYCQRARYFQGHCSCAAHAKYGGKCELTGVNPSNCFIENMESVNGEAPMLNYAAQFVKDHAVPKGTTVSFGQCGKLKGHLTKNVSCGTSQWKDVPGKVKSFCDTACVKPSNDIVGRGHGSGQLGEAFTNCSKESVDMADSFKEQEMSNISYGCSIRAVTQSSIEFKNIDSTVATGNTECTNNLVVDEGSGIDKCWSSDDAFESDRSNDFYGSTCKKDSRKEGSCKVINNQSSRSLLDEVKLMDSLTWKKGRRHFLTGITAHGKVDHSQKSDMDLKTGKRRREMKLNMLDASRGTADLVVHNEYYKRARTAESLYLSKDAPVVLCGQETSHTSGACSANPSSKTGKSMSSQTKALARKRDLHRLYNERIAEDHHRSEFSGNATSYKNLKVSGRKKFRSTGASDSCLHFETQEPSDAVGEKTAEYDTVSSIKASSSQQAKVCNKKARPVVCGKYGEISNDKMIGGVSRPAKILSLDRVLETARRCTLPKNCKPRITFSTKSKRTSSSWSNMRFGKFSNFKKLKESVSNDALLCDEMNLHPSVEEKENASTSSCRQFADKFSLLDEERDDGSAKDCVVLDTNADSQSSFKEIRKRSLSELTLKGNSSSSGMLSHKKIFKCASKMKVGKNWKNSEHTKDHICGLHELNAKRHIQERKYLSAMDLDLFCCVCGSSNKDEVNCLLECGQCLIRVHQACYGVSKVPKGRWYCRPCRTSSKNIVCVLCGYGGGAMTRALRSRTIVKSLLKAWNLEIECRPKDSISFAEPLHNELSILHSTGSVLENNSYPILRPVNIVPSPAVWDMDMENQLGILQNSLSCVGGIKVHNSITAGVLDSTVKQWVHMVCGLWTPGTRCPNVDTMSAFDVSGISRPRANVVCAICNRLGGSCIQCRVVNCSVQFHPWCAHQKGLLQSEVEGVDNENVGFYGRCVLHATYLMEELACAATDIETGCPGQKAASCARTEGYKGRKRDGFWHNHNDQAKGRGGCLVPQDQLNAWIHINGQKLCTWGISKLPMSDVEYDCRKEYGHYKQARGWKHLVVYKSGIHALGLYTSRFISRGEMVVEYVGEIVGLRVADKRENEYQSGRKLQYKSACYFFRIDKEHIIDATRKGGIARFVNHSCLPNCAAKVISVRNDKKVVFFAERDIYPGEEITYDYHFNHEDEGKKIPCFCNSKNCRRYLN